MADKSGADGGLRELALFAGAGGGILGGHLLGWRTVCAVEYEPYAAGVLIARQNDGILPPFPIWDDVRTFDGKPWHGIVDVVSGGFPCQDISSAGKGAGIDGERSGLWGEMARIIGEVRPRFAFVENSPILTSRGLGRVLGDLAALGYDAEWGVMGAADVGAPHKRDRIWILATDSHSTSDEQQYTHAETRGNGSESDSNVAHTQLQGLERHAGYGTDRHEPGRINTNQDGSTGASSICDPTITGLQDRPAGAVRESEPHQESKRSDWWTTEPNMGRVAHGVAARVDRLKAIGNGQVPAVASTAFMKLIAAQRGEE